MPSDYLDERLEQLYSRSGLGGTVRFELEGNFSRERELAALRAPEVLAVRTIPAEQPPLLQQFIAWKERNRWSP